MKALGLDIGAKTIGLAISDELQIAAHPYSVLARRGTKDDVASLLDVVTAHEIGVVVVGIPFELSGREGLRAKRVRVLWDALKLALAARVQYVEVDERFTTAQAQRVLIDAGLRRDRRAEVIDQQAAALILQTWLDGQRRAE